MKLVIAMTGATGALLGITLLKALKENPTIEIHLIVSHWAKVTLEIETDYKFQDVAALADFVYGSSEQGATISSGSVRMDGMIIVPCSMKTLAGIRFGYADNLIARTADVMIKERQKLILVPRETPLSSIHLDNMLVLSNLGVTILPPMMTFYNHPQTIEDMSDQIVARVLAQFNMDYSRAKPWPGLKNMSNKQKGE